MHPRLGLAVLLGLAACGDNNNNDPDAPRPDSRPNADGPTNPDGSPNPDGPTPDADDTPDATIVDAAEPDAPLIDSPPVAGHLLITEVKTTGASEFVEIYNPTGAAVDLTNYYLADINDYWQYPGHVAGNVTIALQASDFIEKFPDGTTIPAGGVLVIATDAPDFVTLYTAEPNFTLDEMSASSVSMVTLITNTGPNPGLTNDGEMVVLFAWDGASDLVQDVDIVVAGAAPSAGNTLIAKAPVDGPDGDTNATAYLADALTIQDMEADTVDDMAMSLFPSYKRIAAEGANEVASGGNGITGHDETSEQSRTTWDSNGTNAYTNGTPGTVPSF
jgi:hypothetical protein